MEREHNILKQIYWNLHNGIVYGKYITDVKYPYFDECLYLHPWQNCICWHNYGSSANNDTEKDLLWIITTIFETTPEQFIKDYTCEHRF